MTDLRPTHRGYGYQDLLAAIRLVDLVLGAASKVLVDQKESQGDLFDDLTVTWPSGRRERTQVKHTDDDRHLLPTVFTLANASLRLDKVFTSVSTDLAVHPGSTYRIVTRDTAPSDSRLTGVLKAVSAGADPGAAIPGIDGTRMRFDPTALSATEPWRSLLENFDAETIARVCQALTIDVGSAPYSADIRAPDRAEHALLRRAATELGAGLPPNRHRSPEDVALALVDAAKRARGRTAEVRRGDLVPALDLTVDFGAVEQGHPVDRNVEISRATLIERLGAAVADASRTGGTVVLEGPPGIGKSWLCEQLADRYQHEWLVARHHCWLGSADENRGRRVLTDVVIGSLLDQIHDGAPDVVAAMRPRFAATADILQTAVAEAVAQRPDRPLVLIVDGLDHVTRVLGRTQGAAFASDVDPAAELVQELAAIPLPAGAALLLSSQPGTHLTTADRTGTSLTVPALTRPEVQSLAGRLGVLAALARARPGQQHEDDADEIVDVLWAKSQGNALYATYLCRQAVGQTPTPGQPSRPPLIDNDDPLDRLRLVPPSAQDLDAYYGYLLAALTPEQRSVVGLLAVCDFAISAAELREIFPVAVPDTALSNVAPVIAQQPGIGGLRIHHESFSRFVLARENGNRIAAVQSQAADWLTTRGFFNDARAFRHLPELLIALHRDTDLFAMIEPDFVARAIAALQPPTAITHVLDLVAARAAARLDWPNLLRYVELRRTADNHAEEGIPGTIVQYASVMVDLLGADAVAASLVYDGRPTVAARWGLQLCAAVDAAGAAAPWASYLQAWERAREDDNVVYGRESDLELDLALQRGALRTADASAIDAGGSFQTHEEWLAVRLSGGDLATLDLFLDVFADCVGATVVLEAARLMTDPRRQAEVLLYLADLAAEGHPDMPTPASLAAEAWSSSKAADPVRLLRHGVPLDHLVAALFDNNVRATLDHATGLVIRESVTNDPVVVQRWLGLLTVAWRLDRWGVTSLLTHLTGVGFYPAWLRFVVAITGLRHDTETGVIDRDGASAAVLSAVSALAKNADPFTGDPRACDLWSIEATLHETFEEAIALLVGADLIAAVAHFKVIADGTTTSLMGGHGSGPLTVDALLAILTRHVDSTQAAQIRPTMDLAHAELTERQSSYFEIAAFDLELARFNLATGGRAEAIRCWERAASYLACYGSHKDVTLYDLLDPVPGLAAADLIEGRARLARIQPLTYLAAAHTDGRETGGLPERWWRQLADLDPAAAADLSSSLLLELPGTEHHWADAAHQQLLHSQATTADPVVMAALRITAGAAGRDVANDIVLLDRLAALPTDDPARSSGAVAALANAITATYDDEPIEHASHSNGPPPSSELRDAARRCGADGGPPRQAAASARQNDRASVRRLPDFQAAIRDTQRPQVSYGAEGALAAVRDYARRRYADDLAAPRWSAEALIAAVGWRLVDLAANEGAERAIEALLRITREVPRFGRDDDLLEGIAEGFELRRGADLDLGRLASAAYTVAYTSNSGGGWRTFAGGRRVELWSRAATLDIDTAAAALAHEIRTAVSAGGYRTYGVTPGVVAAFLSYAPDTAAGGPTAALAAWDAAYEVIARRLPGEVPPNARSYRPTTPGQSQHVTDMALAELAVATIAEPSRDDKRRALLAATALCVSRPLVAQPALARVLAAGIGAGPRTWLLSIIYEHLSDVTPLDDDLADRLADLAVGDMLSVRVIAADILDAHGRPRPSPPATAPHPAIARAFTSASHEQS